jgi:hypothetical protein
VLSNRKRRCVSTNQAKLHELFRDTLLGDEEIYWIGEPLHNYWHFKGRYLFRILGILAFMPFVSAAVLAIVFGFTVVQGLIQMMSIEAPLLGFYIGLLFINMIGRYYEQKHLEARSVPEMQKANYWWKPSYYAITNRRVLIFEQGSIRDYWFHLLDAPILKKPKNRAASIDLYSSTYAAKKKKTPVLDSLRGIPEEEADDAFAILKQAWEEALDERARKNGMD